MFRDVATNTAAAITTAERIQRTFISCSPFCLICAVRGGASHDVLRGKRHNSCAMVSPTQEDLAPQGNIPNITTARIQFQRLFLSPPMGLPQAMQAVVIPVHGDASVLQYTKVPTPQPGPGEVLVKVGAVGLNHLDIFVRRGMPGKAVLLPHISGADVAGVVVAAGPRTSGAPMGQRGLGGPAGPDGAVGGGVAGGGGDYGKVPAANLLPPPHPGPLER